MEQGEKSCYKKEYGESKWVWILSFATSIAAVLLFLRFSLKLDQENWTGIWAWVGKGNLNLYFSVLVVFFAEFLVGRWIFSCLLEKPSYSSHLKYPPYLGKIVTLAIVGGVLFLLLNWLTVQQYFEFGGNPAHLPISKVPAGYIAVLLTTGVMLIIWAIREKRDISRSWVLYVYALCVVLTFWGLYYPNIFAADIHHGIAALESIFNVADMTPYTYATTGIYGHYALFFLLPLKLLGCSIETVAGLMAFFGCIACVAVLYVIHQLLPQNWMRALAAFASIVHVVIFRNSNYWQVQPIRVLFPCIFMAYAVYLCKSKAKVSKYEIGYGWLLGVLAVLWNTESGVFCLLAFVAFLLTKWWQTYNWYEKKMWYAYGFSIMFCILAVLASIVIFNIYNLLCGGPLVLRTFFFPLQVKEYIDMLQYNLVWGNHVWIYVMILFLLIFCWGLYHTCWFGHRQENTWKMAPSAVLIAVLGLLNFSYYANRAAFYNLDICFPMAICANMLLIGGLWPQFLERPIVTFDRSCKKAAVVVCMTVVLCLGIQILYAPIRIKERHEAGSQSTISLRTEVEALREAIPENTYGIGGGISILYHILGWNNYGHFRDVSDFGVGGTDALDALKEAALRRDSFLCNANYYGWIRDSILAEDWHYQYEKSVIVQGLEYQYYVRRPYVCDVSIAEDNAAIHFSFRDDSAHASLYAAVWSEEGVQDDLQWFPADYMGNGIWEGNADLHDFDRTGNYIVQFYAIEGDNFALIAETSVAVAALPIDEI